jgi:hypothetical protein
MCTELCMKYVEGGISDEIVTSQRVTNCKVDCPHSCQDDIVCLNCCNCLIGVVVFLFAKEMYAYV